MSFLKVKGKLLYFYCVASMAVSGKTLAAGDPFAKANESTNALLDGLTTVVPALATLMVTVVGLFFIFGKMPKGLALSIAGGCIIIGSASALVGLFYN